MLARPSVSVIHQKLRPESTPRQASKQHVSFALASARIHTMKRPRPWCMRPCTMRCDQGMTTHLSTETHQFTDGLRTCGPNATLHNRSRWFHILQRFPRHRIRVPYTHLCLVSHLTLVRPKNRRGAQEVGVERSVVKMPKGTVREQVQLVELEATLR